MCHNDFEVKKSTLKPEYSIDQVIERVHIVAGNVNELSHVAEDNGRHIVSRGEDSLSKFDFYFKNTSSNVSEMVEVARERFYSIPVGVFYSALICALILIALAIFYLLLFGAQQVLRRRKTYGNVLARERVI